MAYSEQEWIDSNGNIVYPITGKDQEWENFTSHNEMVIACNAPEEILRELSTADLVSLMLDYPLLGDLYLYNNLDDGFKIMSQNSNILQELMEREDGAIELLKAYSKSNITKQTELPENIINMLEENPSYINKINENDYYREIIENESENIIQNIFMETALVQEEFINQLNEEFKSQLLEEVSDKVMEKEQSDLYSAYVYTWYDLVDKNLVNEVKQNLLESETNINARSTTYYVKTPKGSSVEVYKLGHNASESAAAYNYTVKNYPNALIIGAATTNYNCHTYAWYSQSTNNIYWMNNPGKYMEDGSYSKVGTTPTAVNQKVCYIQYPLTNPYIHSGIVYKISGTTITLQSKWGAGPLVIHNVSYSPYGGTPIYYK